MTVDTSTKAVKKLLDTFDNITPTIGQEVAKKLFDLGCATADALEALLDERDALKTEVDRLKDEAIGSQPSQPAAWAESYDGGKFFHTVSLSKTKHHTFPLYTSPQPIIVQDAVRAPEVKALIDALKPFAGIGVSENPDFQTIVRMDRESIIAARAALHSITEGLE